MGNTVDQALMHAVEALRDYVVEAERTGESITPSSAVCTRASSGTDWQRESLIYSEFSVDNSACRRTSCVASSARSGG